jgi:hypothetical protein
MNDARRYLVNVLWDNLGNCVTCIRKAFQAAAAGWCLTLLFAIVGWSQLLPLSLVSAIALTTLWVAHLIIHARKVSGLAKRRDVIHSTVGVSRRGTLSLFTRTVIVGAVLSATPAFAQQCTGGTGSCEQDGCPECTRPCYVRGSTINGCISCRSCGSNCGDNIC